MPAWGFPISSFVGNAVLGRLIPARGLLHNIRLESNPLAPTSPVLAWTHTDQDGIATADRVVRIYRDGNLERVVNGYSQTTIPVPRSGAILRYDLEAVTPLESEIIDSSNGFAVYPMGDRVKIQWTENTSDDFDAYKIYWDAGDGGAVDTLLETIYGAANTQTISPKLDDGTTYVFGLALVDVYGNESAVGTTSAIVADLNPLAVSGATISYSTATRKATITATQPTGQHGDCAGAVLYDNYIPGIGLSEYPNVDYPWRRDFSYATSDGAAISFVTPELHAGQWKYVVRAIDKFGAQSTYQTLTINLVTNGATLQTGSIEPVAPTNVSAYATADAKIVVNWYHDGDDTSAFQVYQGGTALGTTTASLTTNPHSYTTGTLTDGTQYTFYVSALNGSSTYESDLSEGSTATADGSAPSGSQALTLELIG